MTPAVGELDITHSIGVRLEDKSQWERRVPLVPADVERLVHEHDLQVCVQPSSIRVYNDQDYRTVGATVDADLSQAKVILSVKEVPRSLLMADRCYCFFAHVIKGQRYNMPLLRDLLDLGITLIDYERIVDESNRRLVKFGREAGQAGMIDSLYALGQRLLQEGHETPLADIRQAYEYADVSDAERAISEIGRRIRSGLDTDEPLIVGFTGRGSVSQGAQEIFDLLPHEVVTADELPEVVNRPERDLIFKVIFKKSHLAAPTNPDKAFDAEEYRQHPERFRGRLHKFMPHVTMLINGIYWTTDYPRFLSRAQVCEMWQRGERRLRLIGDITCDIDGAIELTHKATQPDQPTYIFDPETDRFSDGLEGQGVCVLAVDNLPCELPRDASDHFSRALLDFIPALARTDFSQPFESLHLPEEIERAVITHRGELAPDYRYLEEHLQAAGV